jgi:hypothetical protein
MVAREVEKDETAVRSRGGGGAFLMRASFPTKPFVFGEEGHNGDFGALRGVLLRMDVLRLAASRGERGVIL